MRPACRRRVAQQTYGSLNQYQRRGEDDAAFSRIENLSRERSTGVPEPADGFCSSGPAASPQIRVSTQLVQVGVIVRDSNGPVGNLTKDDFVVLDRGQSQEIRVFSTESSRPTAQPAQPLLHNTYSDQAQLEGATQEA